MGFVAFGLNHKTAPIDVREKIALPASLHESFLNHLIALPGVNEALLLSTCNRTEIYCDAENPEIPIKWLANEYQLPTSVLATITYAHQDMDAVKHLLRVASGLDSMMLGEPQILGQLKQAYQLATKLGTVKNQLRPLFESVFGAVKRIRTQSGIGANPVSIAYAGAQLIGQQFNDIKSLNVFLIGTGETASLVAKYLHQQGAQHFMVASRTLENANKLAQTFEGTPVSITDLPQALYKADVVVTATSCPLPFIDKKMVSQALAQRNHAPILLLDLAVPRDIEPEVNELEGAYLYNVDHLQALIDKGMDARRIAAEKAEHLIESELREISHWHRAQQANEFICNYRTQMQDLTQSELQRALNKINSGQCHTRVLNEFSERLLNKLTHNPTVGLRQIAGDNREDLLELAQYLFNTTVSNSTYEEIP